MKNSLGYISLRKSSSIIKVAKTELVGMMCSTKVSVWTQLREKICKMLERSSVCSFWKFFNSVIFF